MSRSWLRVGYCAVAFLTACGGGGGSGSGGTSSGPSAALVGTYRLTAFTVVLANGQVLTQDQVTTFSGTFVLNSNGTLSQSAEVNGVSSADSGTWTADGSQIYGTSSSKPGCTIVLPYTFNGSVLITTSNRQCGSTNVETDTWLRTGPAPAKPEHPLSNAAPGTLGGLFGH